MIQSLRPAGTENVKATISIVEYICEIRHLSIMQENMNQDFYAAILHCSLIEGES